MILIAHRANLNGPGEQENSIVGIKTAIDSGFHVEIDVRFVNSKFFLGHDSAIEEIKPEWLVHEKVWCHAKNTNTLENLLCIGAHCFFHNQDDCTLTSKKFIWVYPGKYIPYKFGIAVMPEISPEWDIRKAYGICTDFVFRYHGNH